MEDTFTLNKAALVMLKQEGAMVLKVQKKKQVAN